MQGASVWLLKLSNVWLHKSVKPPTTSSRPLIGGTRVWRLTTIVGEAD
jgi:hypothetical protein